MRHVVSILMLTIVSGTHASDANSIFVRIPRNNNQLCISAKQGDLTRCKMLVENEGHDVNGADSETWGQRPLAYAAAHGHESVVTYLISKGAAVTGFEAGCAAYPFTGRPLTEAIKNNHNTVARYLLQNGADPNESDRMFPIIEYTCPWNPENMELLLKYHAKIDNTSLIHHALRAINNIHSYPDLLDRIECTACIALQFGEDEKKSDSHDKRMPCELITPPDDNLTQKAWEHYLYNNTCLTLWGMRQSHGVSDFLHRLAEGENLQSPIDTRETLKLMLGKKQYDDFHKYLDRIDHSRMSAEHWTNIMTHGAILYNRGTHTEDALHQCIHSIKNKRLQMLYHEGTPEDVQIRKQYLQNTS